MSEQLLVVDDSTFMLTVKGRHQSLGVIAFVDGSTKIIEAQALFASLMFGTCGIVEVRGRFSDQADCVVHVLKSDDRRHPRVVRSN
jgi:hypothetical protein